jgi:hypothetical protein
MISRCPKRVLEGGIIGTTDLGYCIDVCGAFKPKRVLQERDDILHIDIDVYYGKCKEYKNMVVASRNVHHY